jgi:hypothetical protein
MSKRADALSDPLEELKITGTAPTGAATNKTSHPTKNPLTASFNTLRKCGILSFSTIFLSGACSLLWSESIEFDRRISTNHASLKSSEALCR